MTTPELQYPGIWRVRLGVPETHTPVSLRHRAPAAAGLEALGGEAVCPMPAERIEFQSSARGCQVVLPLQPDEQLYGLGLQLHSVNQRGKKKLLRVNSDPRTDLGDSHAPVPFYVSTRGYGVLIDTLRYATFYVGCTLPRRDRRAEAARADGVSGVQSAEEIYAAQGRKDLGPVAVDIPTAQGADVYIFAGPDLRRAVQRYVLFSGGGCLPPLWGLGVWYRGHRDFSQQDFEELAGRLREDRIPCDVLGFEPSWQTHSYSCSFVWSQAFPDPKGMLARLKDRGFHVNLWTHAFVDRTSPLYERLLPLSGDYEVWQGLVPDLALPEVRGVMAELHEKEHVALGVSGYKLDECDSSDYISPPWSYPELSRFPSGLDGEQMHSAMGLQYQEMVDGIFRRRNQRTYAEARSAHALAAPYPYVLYSDLYNHAEFLRGVVNAGFCGLLWSPEVRHADGPEELIRRLQTAVMSPQALINGWYIKNPPWKQWETQKNNAGELAENYRAVEAACREVLLLRMRLIPYLYAAFARYHWEGVPPFRALVMDFPDDPNAWNIQDAYLMGDGLLVAPLLTGQKQRPVYLPSGAWHDFWTHEPHEGGRTIEVAKGLDEIPIFVREGTLLPLARPVECVKPDTAFELTVHAFGSRAASFVLYEDDGVTHDYDEGQQNRVVLQWDGRAGTVVRTGGYRGPERYRVVEWKP